MPELPEVETVCRGLQPRLEGHTLTAVVQRRPDLRFPIPEDFVARLTGQRVERIERRAKYILTTLGNGTVMMLHLGMSGRLTLHPGAPPPPGPHDHLELTSDSGWTVRFCDPRRFGFVDLTSQNALADHPMLRTLGPEPLSGDFSAAYLDRALAGRRTPVKSALLDQKIIAGLGNIYVCEALFRAGISPKRSAHTIPGVRAARLVPIIRNVLEEAIAAGGSSLRDYVQTDGELGYFQHSWRVYAREGGPCGGPDGAGCTGTIRRIQQSGRSTFYCSRHQR